ncbi:MAG: DUF305 domain-containing protein [Sphingobacteriales bacterium]|nr:MAG: DUF305 domain-containing protein [Sphingobacteriales bacterium]
MTKAFLLSALVLAAVACDSNTSGTEASSTDTTHVQHDAGGHTTDTTASSNVMKASMDSMMMAMHTIKPTGNNDVDFANMMIAHHQGAVNMSKLLVEKGSNAILEEFAQKVITDQEKEIAVMKRFADNANPAASSTSADFQKAMNQSMMAMMNAKTTVHNQADKDYAAQMIPHHQSAVDMAKAYLQYGKDPILNSLCQGIVNAQSTEIDWLTEWLERQTL